MYCKRRLWRKKKVIRNTTHFLLFFGLFATYKREEINYDLHELLLRVSLSVFLSADLKEQVMEFNVFKTQWSHHIQYI